MGLEELFAKLRAARGGDAPAEVSGEAYLIVGLGNPGREYRDTRHNVGFMVVDALARSLDTTLSRVQSNAIVGSGSLAGKRVILAKPQTYMNLSGQAVGPLMKFYKVPNERLMVIHDDLDLPLGVLRLRPGGGSAGQKGVASIIQRLGSQEFARLRVGIGRPNGSKDAADYVLTGFTRGEHPTADAVLARAVDAVRTFIQDDLDKAMNLFNGGLPEA